MIDRDTIKAAENDAATAVIQALKNATWKRVDPTRDQVFKTHVGNLLVKITRVDTGTTDRERATITLSIDGRDLGTRGYCVISEDSVRGNKDLADIWSRAEHSWLVNITAQSERHACKAQKNQTEVDKALTELYSDIAGIQVERLMDCPREGDISHHVKVGGSPVAYLRTMESGYQWEAFGHKGATDDYGDSIRNLYRFMVCHLVPRAFRAGIHGRSVAGK